MFNPSDYKRCMSCGEDLPKDFEGNICMECHKMRNITTAADEDVIVIELTREECECIHMLCDIARAYKKEHVYFQNYKDLIARVDDKMTPGYNCLYCKRNLCDCQCIRGKFAQFGSGISK